MSGGGCPNWRPGSRFQCPCPCASAGLATDFHGRGPSCHGLKASRCCTAAPERPVRDGHRARSLSARPPSAGAGWRAAEPVARRAVVGPRADPAVAPRSAGPGRGPRGRAGVLAPRCRHRPCGPHRRCGSTAICIRATCSLADGRLSAVIDFGDLSLGDPATDFAIAWMVTPTFRRALREAARDRPSPLDDDTWARARGWALALGARLHGGVGRRRPDDRAGPRDDRCRARRHGLGHRPEQAACGHQGRRGQKNSIGQPRGGERRQNAGLHGRWRQRRAALRRRRRRPGRRGPAASRACASGRRPPWQSRPAPPRPRPSSTAGGTRSRLGERPRLVQSAGTRLCAAAGPRTTARSRRAGSAVASRSRGSAGSIRAPPTPCWRKGLLRTESPTPKAKCGQAPRPESAGHGIDQAEGICGRDADGQHPRDQQRHQHRIVRDRACEKDPVVQKLQSKRCEDHRRDEDQRRADQGTDVPRRSTVRARR